MAHTINLYTDLEKGTTKEYKAKRMSSLYIMKAMRLGKKIEEQGEAVDISLIDDLLDLIVEVYNDQFTKDEMLSGIPAEEFMDTIQEQLMLVAAPQVESETTKDFLDKKKK